MIVGYNREYFPDNGTTVKLNSGYWRRGGTGRLGGNRNQLDHDTGQGASGKIGNAKQSTAMQNESS